MSITIKCRASLSRCPLMECRHARLARDLVLLVFRKLVLEDLFPRAWCVYLDPVFVERQKSSK
jgi:hypothetical protein